MSTAPTTVLRSPACTASTCTTRLGELSLATDGRNKTKLATVAAVTRNTQTFNFGMGASAVD
jgi:hypothetical protein